MVVAVIDCPFGGKLEFREHSPIDYVMFQVFGSGDNTLEQYVGIIRKQSAETWFQCLNKPERMHLSNNSVFGGESK